MLSQLQNQIETLRSGIQVSFVDRDALSQLQAVVDRSDGLLRKSRNNVIKTTLQVPDMDSRYTEVSEAYSHTFTWILQDSEEEPPTAEVKNELLTVTDPDV